MPTPPANGAESISQRTGGLRNPWSSDDLRMLRISFHREVPFRGVKPTSRMEIKATTKVRPSTSQASVAPEKNVKPSPSSIELSAHAQNGPWLRHIQKYRRVDTKS